MKKNGIFEYVLWRGDLSFDKAPFSDIDSLIFSLISYIDYFGIVENNFEGEGVKLSYVSEKIKEKPKDQLYLGAIISEEITELLHLLGKSVRYGDVRIIGFENIVSEEWQSQFCAITFIIGKRQICVAYRGTDDTLVGWKENFDMSYLKNTVSQEMSVIYLDLAADLADEIYVCGHSKGGNLAVYAAVNVDARVSDKISLVYNCDGPGFSKSFFDSEGYSRIRDRVVTFIPNTSVVGMIFEKDKNFRLVKSRSRSVMSHDIFSWETCGPNLVLLKRRSFLSEKNEKLLNSYINSFSSEEKRDIIDAIYSQLVCDGAKTLSDIKKSKIKTVSAIIRALLTHDPASEQNMMKIFGKLLFQKAINASKNEVKKP